MSWLHDYSFVCECEGWLELTSWASLNLSPSVRSILRCYDTAVEDVSIQTGDRPLSISILRCSEYCRGCLDINWWPSSLSAPLWLGLGSRRHGKWDVRDCDHSGFWGTARLSTFPSFRRSYVIHSSHLGGCPTITFGGSSLSQVDGGCWELGGGSDVMIHSFLFSVLKTIVLAWWKLRQ